MVEQQGTWTEFSDRLEALALKLKLHFEQTRGDEVPDAIGKLRRGVEDAFEAAGNAVKDDAVRSDVRDMGRLLADAVATTLAKVSDDLRDRAHRSDENNPAIRTTDATDATDPTEPKDDKS